MTIIAHSLLSNTVSANKCSVRHTLIFSKESSLITIQDQGHLSIHSFLCYRVELIDNFHIWPNPFVPDKNNFVHLAEDKWSTVLWNAVVETSHLEYRKKRVDFCPFGHLFSPWILSWFILVYAERGLIVLPDCICGLLLQVRSVVYMLRLGKEGLYYYL